MKTRIAVFGAAGRMGRTLLRLILESKDLALAAAYERADHPDLGRDAGLLVGASAAGRVLSTLPDRVDADAVVDFSLPEGTAQLVRVLRKAPRTLVCGSTGLPDAVHDELASLAVFAPVVWAPNFSLGVNLLCELVRRAATVLGPGVEVEIAEVHHRHKKDAPSGTAMRLVEVAAAALGERVKPVAVHGRSGQTGERPANQIGVHALRGGEVIGEHTVYLFGSGERLELTHRLAGREALAGGALRAARWTKGRAPGLYDMLDVLDLKP